MLGLTCFEVYNSIFNTTEENNNFELYKDNFDDCQFAKLKDAVEQVANVSDMSEEKLKDDTIGPVIISIYGKLQLEKLRTDGYTFLLMSHHHFETLQVILELHVI